MKETPFFSIIIPTHNRATLLPRAIQSVQQQTFKNWELIIIDDESTDDTPAVVQAFLSDERIQYHWQENRELNGARNTGIQLASGNYIAFLDDDDCYLSHHLMILNKYLVSNGSPIVSIRSGMYLQQSDKQTKGYLLAASFPNSLIQLWESPVNLLSFAFHHQIFDKYLFDESFVLAEDLHFLLQVLLDFPFVQLHEFTVVYQLQEDSRSLTYHQPQHLKNKVLALQHIWSLRGDDLQQHLPHLALSQKICREHLHFARIASRSGQQRLGWSYWVASLKYFNIKNIRNYLRTLICVIFGR